MAKFHGSVGFVRTEETSPGIHEEITTERLYTGDLIREIKQLRQGDQVNPNVAVNNRISILADAYAEENLTHIRYVVWNGASWSVSSFEINYPRIILSIRGVYNG